MEKIYVTQPFLAPKDEYQNAFSAIFDSKVLTNQGPKVQELETVLKNFLHADFFHYVSNGTIALQLALKALNITQGEIITTPFSYVATVSSVLWERCTPVFIDIEEENFTINTDLIEEKITEKTAAIMPVHVFGYACNVEKLQKISQKYNIPVIYDAAHAFGSVYCNKHLVTYGDISTCSFHATKLFHTVEGGACIAKNKEISDKLELIKRFGHIGDTHYTLGINAKQSEFHAAAGIVNFTYLPQIIEKRKLLSKLYDSELNNIISRPKVQKDLEYNYAYYPVLFKNEQDLLKVFAELEQNNIYARRYFYPSLNTLPYIKNANKCPTAENISLRIACLPLFFALTEENVQKICKTIKKVLI